MKYAPGLMVGQLSGKAGSTVASHNRFGSYFRTRNIPVNPNTIPQQDNRNNFAAISQGWRSLSDSQRAGWDAAAANVNLVDALGTSYAPTGQQYFISINRGQWIYNNAASIDPSAPVPAPPSALLTLSISALAFGSFDVAYTATPLPASTKLVFEATRPLSPGVKFVGRSEFKQVLITAAAAASPADLSAAYEAMFGPVPSGARIFLRAYKLDVGGQRSAYVQTDAIST